jgi:DUF1680 family protein
MHLKLKISFVLLLLSNISFNSFSIDSTSVNIEGFVGKKIDLIIEKRIIGQDVDMLVDPFKLKNETWCWQSEFWGKWMLSAVAAYRYRPDEELLAKMQYAVKGLLDTQIPNGYIGNYGPENQLTRWDIWGRKYSMLGLIRYFEITGDQAALMAARKVADHLLSQLGPGKTDITYTGFYHGMASSSVLEPILYLYNHTDEKRYLDFAEYVIKQWETEDGPRLISKAIESIDVKDRFPPPPSWWSWENGQKAYEMMSCYEGLLEYYKIVKNPQHLEAVVKTVDNIMEHEINIAGSGSAFECWYGGKEKQTIPTYHTMETCVTMTWMKLCNSLLELTNDPKYADQIEKTFYNALLASARFDASNIAKYSPLMGVRSEGEQQCSMPINCCNANGPRGFTLMPEYALKSKDNEIYINYLGQFQGIVTLENGSKVMLKQITQYPKDGKIRLTVDPEKKESFKLNVRIPAWSENTTFSINGEMVPNPAGGAYVKIDRNWQKGDIIEFEIGMKGSLHQNNEHQAITWGPVVLARDSRFQDGDVDESIIIENQKSEVVLVPDPNPPANIWLSFTASCKVGTNLETQGKEPKFLHFCDFASAGNTWSEQSRYRVWIIKTLNVMNMNYEKY